MCLGGLIKHVAAVERTWADFILNGPSAIGDAAAMTEEDWARRDAEFRLLPDETLAGVLADYAEVARRTDELVATLPDLDAAHPLPKAPWFEPGAQWSARRVLMHVIAETAQHAGHADIIRESLDGAKSMG
ncbi:DinB family protein [Actinomadura rubrobrunea]